jgi:hypothetical protein
MLRRLDLAAANLASALERLVKGFQLLFLLSSAGFCEGLRARVTARVASRGTSQQKQCSSMHLSRACISYGSVSHRRAFHRHVSDRVCNPGTFILWTRLCRGPLSRACIPQACIHGRASRERASYGRPVSIVANTDIAVERAKRTCVMR